MNIKDSREKMFQAPQPEANTVTTRRRAPKRQLTGELKSEIARQVNEEKRRAKDVAYDFAVPVNLVYRVAGTARGEGRYVQLPEKPGERSRRIVQPKTDAPMPPAPPSLGEPCDLRRKALSAAEKEYLACLVNIKRMTAVQVGRQYNLLSDSVSRYARDALTKTTRFQRHGRPHSRLDDESHKVLQSLAAIVPRVPIGEFRTQLAEQFNKTCERRRVKRSSSDSTNGAEEKPRPALAGPLQLEASGAECARMISGERLGSLLGGILVRDAEISQPPAKKTYIDRETYKTYLGIYGFSEDNVM